MRHTVFVRRWIVPAAVGIGALIACDRERVEVAEDTAAEAGVDGASDGAASAPTFPDAKFVIEAGCVDDTPPVAACGYCPKGFKVVDGSPTCDCCE